jgi:hypothetical protein
MIDRHLGVTQDEPSHIHIVRPSRARHADHAISHPLVALDQQPVDAYRARADSFTFTELEPAERSVA